MFLAVGVENYLRGDMAISMPWANGGWRVIVECQRPVQIFSNLRMKVSIFYKGRIEKSEPWVKPLYVHKRLHIVPLQNFSKTAPRLESISAELIDQHQ